jgi:hypothetical protein
LGARPARLAHRFMNHESNETAGAVMGTQARESGAPERARAASNEIVVASPDAVAIRAYELFEERGREAGRDVDDWLRAERELKGARR